MKSFWFIVGRAKPAICVDTTDDSIQKLLEKALDKNDLKNKEALIRIIELIRIDLATKKKFYLTSIVKNYSCFWYSSLSVPDTEVNHSTGRMKASLQQNKIPFVFKNWSPSFSILSSQSFIID